MKPECRKCELCGKELDFKFLSTKLNGRNCHNCGKVCAIKSSNYNSRFVVRTQGVNISRAAARLREICTSRVIWSSKCNYD